MLKSLCIRGELQIVLSRTTRQPSNVSFNSPSPFIPLLPLKQLPTEVNLNCIFPFQAYSSVYVMILTREINTCKSNWQAIAVVRVENAPIDKFVSIANDVSGRNVVQLISVIAAAIWILKEFAEIIKMETRTQSIPSRQSPRWIWTTSRA
jgi:hypothetical protein